jgi:hypothetical protein
MSGQDGLVAGLQGPGDDVDSGGMRDVVEVVLSWGDGGSRTVLGVTQVLPGGRLALGESGEILVPAQVLGTDRAEVVCFEAGRATAIVPPESRLRLRVDGWDRDDVSVDIEPGHVVELIAGRFVVRLALVRAEPRLAGAPLEGLRGSGAGFIAGSATLHLAAFLAIAFFAPALGATEENPYDADRLALMQRLLDAHAEPETDRQDTGLAAQNGGQANSGQPAHGAEGTMGRPAARDNGRWAARGDARPEEATLPRERVLSQAAQFGMIGLLASLPSSDPDVPIVPWGSTLRGADDQSAVGHLYGDTIGDAPGHGLGLSGLDEGGGGHADAIGLNNFGPLGHTGTCLGPGPCDGIGVGRGHPGGQHVSHFKPPRYGEPICNGHLPAEVIRRIVRQNDGRYRFCYETGLRNNPNLQGRVTVRFVIDRGGSVALASDAGSDIPDEDVRRCVVSSFTNLSFPAPDSGLVTVVYPIVFSPQ